LDTTFLTGIAVFVSSLIVFCGSVWLLLAVVLGSRLAYFITASVTLAFTFLMGIVWSFTPLGPLGKLPSFEPEAIGTSADEVEFAQASSYPEGDWVAASPEDEEQLQKQTDLEGAAGDYLEQAIEEGDIDTFKSATDASVVAESARLLTAGDQEYGAVLMQEAPEEGQDAPEANVGDPNTVLVVMRYDPGNPLGMARTITLGTLVLLVLHLFLLSRAERNAKRVRAQYA